MENRNPRSLPPASRPTDAGGDRTTTQKRIEMPEIERFAPTPFTAQDLRGAKTLQEKLGSKVPADFNTEFFWARWFRAYNGDIAGIEKKIDEYMTHRRNMGYDGVDIAKFLHAHPIAKATFERFAISRHENDVFSGDVMVFLQKMDGVELKEIMKAIPLSNVLHSYYVLQDGWQRAMLAHEQKTGRPAGVVSVLDLKGLNLADFINPLSTSAKLARLVVKIWSEFFSENLIRLYLLNPPGILSVIWQCAKFIMDKRTQSRVVILQKPEDILLHLDKEAVPVELGGLRIDESGFSHPPESCCNPPKPVTNGCHYDQDKMFKEINLQGVPDLKTVSVKSKHKHDVTKECKEGQHLLWHFTINGDIDFEIVYSADGGKTEESVWPRITLTSLKAPEQGKIVCKRTGQYHARFTNSTGGWIPVKLHYGVVVR
ncbi:hypothetical protein L596_018551 [Steinernema carpocapsae]|uniref:CRAL-TRIO domain-containing protein n=1 Tax=Steinernema carpocapsae TaxID=34508 RepID=A0A4U5N4Z7_STECR|nr:hypothetical protein L596_018551 [Steinernema carpocapsae]